MIPRLIKKLGRTSAGQWLVAGVLAFYVFLVWQTSRVVRVGQPAPGQKIMALWHGRLALATYFDTQHPLRVMVSQHQDGIVIARAARLHGAKAVHGSSREGALSGFRQALRTAASGTSLLITPDGPTGPRMHAQPGATELARMTGLPVVPVAFSAHRARQLRSWDRGLLPLPFSRLVLVYGTPMTLSRQATETEVDAFTLRLAAAITAAQDVADKICHRTPVAPATPEEIAARAAKNAWKTRKAGAAR